MSGRPMLWTFRALAALDLLLLGLALFYRSPGEDPAGEALRLSFAFFYALALGVVLLLYRFVRVAWARGLLLVLLALPPASLLYGLWLSR